MNVGDRIRQRRIELGLTQDELAKKAGYKSRSSINKIETSRDLPLKKIKSVAQLLNCSPSYLMGWEEKENQMQLAQIDVELSNIPFGLKKYAIKLSKLNQQEQEIVLNMIDLMIKNK